MTNQDIRETRIPATEPSAVFAYTQFVVLRRMINQFDLDLATPDLGWRQRLDRATLWIEQITLNAKCHVDTRKIDVHRGLGSQLREYPNLRVSDAAALAKVCLALEVRTLREYMFIMDGALEGKYDDFNGVRSLLMLTAEKNFNWNNEIARMTSRHPFMARSKIESIGLDPSPEGKLEFIVQTRPNPNVLQADTQ